MAEIDLNTPHAAPVDASREAQDSSLGALISQLTSDFSDLVSTQVQLAKVEIKEEVARAGKGAGLMTGAGLAGYLALLLLSFAAAWGLDEAMPSGLAFLIVGLAWALIAGVLYTTGRKQIDSVRLPPPQTKASIEEDIEWAKRQKS
jgi:uncharacterized membrane protein YqjE